MTQNAREQAYMEQAFALAWAAKGKTLPNPPVGALLVKGGRIVGQGKTRPAGQAHAEIVALEQAREAAQGATLYVTLEPCRHFGKTPPCTRALIQAGVKKVMAACADPNPLVGGRGLSDLRRAGLTVETGLLREKAERLYDGFFFHVRNGRPKIVLKVAQSLDGRINGKPGLRTAITGAESRRFVHHLRAGCDAVLIGGGTLRADNPRLTARLALGPSPEALVLTRRRRLDPGYALFRRRDACVLTLPGRALGLPPGVERRELPGAAGENPRALSRALLAVFRDKGYHKVLVEGGRSLWAAFLNAGLCDQLYVLKAPVWLPRGERWDESLAPGWPKSLQFHSFQQLGIDILADFRPAE